MKCFDKPYSVSTYKRPLLDKFLDEVFEIFEVVFYTPAVASYANKVIDQLDPNRFAAGRLFRESCIIQEEHYIKDIERLGRDLESVIILDSNPVACCYSLQNAVPIKPWFNDPNDTELDDLLTILKSLAKVKDVRKVIQKIMDKITVDSDQNQNSVSNVYQNPKNIKKEDR